MSTGTEQRERFPAALEAGYFQVDELAFEHRVAMTAALARQLRFIDLGNQDAGNWSPLFASDVTLVLARIASIDLYALQSGFLRDFESAPLEQLAHQVVALAHWLDLWFKSLAGDGDHAARAMRERIRQLVEQQLGEDLRWVHRHFGGRRWQGQAIAHRQHRLAEIWAHDRPLLAAGASQRSERELLRERYFAFLSAIDGVQNLARELLPATLHSGTHEPAAGLFIAFLKLYESVQHTLNRFSARHVDFYYRDCLGFSPADPAPDRVHLACLRDARAAGEVSVPAGTVFDAGKDAAGRPVRFRSDEAVVVTDARVAALCTLRLERDALISPEREFGFVTRAKATRLAPDGSTAWPLFGGGRARAADDARIGLAVASPLLLLREGEREIHLELRLPSSGDAPALEALVDEVAGARGADALRDAFGRLLGRWLLSDGTELSAAQWQRLRDAARRELGGELPAPAAAGDPLGLLNGSGLPERALMFERVFQGLFKLQLSAADGWLDASDAHVARAPGGGLAISLRLRPEAPAIVGCDPVLHGAGWPTRLPLMRLEVGTQGRLYPYSLLAALPLAEAMLRVSASGVRDVMLYNNLGRLDPGKAFNPFGPLPVLSSYLIVGAQEAACKNIRRLALHIEWGGLPIDAGGFDTYYRGYGAEQREGSFTAALSLLRDGQWQGCSGVSAQQPLFAGLDDTGHLLPAITIEVDPGSVRKNCRASTEDWSAGTMPRNGLCRLQLSGPRGAFGHAAYPVVLADVVTANARTKRPQPLPNPPYTPLIERLTLSYEAASVIHLERDDGAQPGADTERLLHLHPFGIEALQTAAAGARHGLLPRFEQDGNLYIGIAATDPGGTLTLLFQLRESAAEATPRPGRSRITWATLAGDQWRPLPPARVLADSTQGFLTSGIVTLDLPRDLTCDNGVMPAGLYWLRLSAADGFEGFASLQSVQAQALHASRVMPEGAVALAALAEGSITQPVSSLPGLAAVAQLGPSAGLRAAEDQRALYTRAGERLQHKQRASNAWDVERLLLARFPEVFKVRCLSADAAGGPPGQVLAVVVPQVPRNQPALALAAPRFNAVELRRMADYLAGLSSPFARVQVRNPAYERIQLRCAVGLQRGAHEGAALQRINQAVIEYLSPWFDGGYGPRFDWLVRSEDLEARLRALEGVAFVTQLSLLSVACSDEAVYTLSDTARAPAGVGAGHVRARTPWSLALPMATHIVGAAESFPDPAPLVTGVSRLAIGSTFVIGAGGEAA